MRRSEELISLSNTYGAHNYHPLPVVLNKGVGAKVWDVDGNEYLDFLACYSALNFGHQNPTLVAALKAQLDQLALCSRAFFSEEHCLLVQELAEFCGLESVLPMNSGTEAVETALKICRKWGYERKGVAKDKAKVIVMENGFHGRTISVISFSTEALYRNGFGPFTPGFQIIPFGDIRALERAIDEDTVGVLFEPIQAEAGILIPPPGYLSDVRQLCDRQGVLMLVDEIQTGMARTGRNFTFEYENATPDLLILGKSLGGGLLPISAVVAKKEVMDVIGPGQHGSTFGGNPLACAVARSVLKLLADGSLAAKATRLGEMAQTELTRKRLPGVKEVRGKGALIGIEMDPSAGGARRYTEVLAREGILCKETHDHVIRIAPPLVIEEADFLNGLNKICTVIEQLA
jgi:ornithine--oxo-acid transaminase